MLTEKILFQNRSLAFYYHPRPPLPPVWQKTTFFPVFFLCTLPLTPSSTSLHTQLSTPHQIKLAILKARHWSDDAILGGRAFFRFVKIITMIITFNFIIIINNIIIMLDNVTTTTILINIIIIIIINIVIIIRGESEPGRLVLDNVNPSDAGIYKCRVDFRFINLLNTHLQLRSTS